MELIWELIYVFSLLGTSWSSAKDKEHNSNTPDLPIGRSPAWPALGKLPWSEETPFLLPLQHCCSYWLFGSVHRSEEKPAWNKLRASKVSATTRLLGGILYWSLLWDVVPWHSREGSWWLLHLLLHLPNELQCVFVANNRSAELAGSLGCVLQWEQLGLLQSFCFKFWDRLTPLQ